MNSTFPLYKRTYKYRYNLNIPIFFQRLSCESKHIVMSEFDCNIIFSISSAFSSSSTFLLIMVLLSESRSSRSLKDFCCIIVIKNSMDVFGRIYVITRTLLYILRMKIHGFNRIKTLLRSGVPW